MFDNNTMQWDPTDEATGFCEDCGSPLIDGFCHLCIEAYLDEGTASRTLDQVDARFIHHSLIDFA